MAVSRRACFCAGVLLLLAGFEWEGRTQRLLHELESDAEGTRIEAARQLARLSGSAVEQALVGALDDPSFDVRFEVARACRARRLTACAPGLRAWIEAADADERAVALRSLGAVGNAEDAPLLARSLGDARATVRRAAAEGLADLEDPAALPPLVRSLDDSDPLVRSIAATALGTRAESSAVEMPAADRSAAVSALLGRTRDEAPEVRAVALDALGAFEDPRSGGAALLALSDDVEDVRLAALGLLTRVPSVSAAAALAELAADEGRIGRAAVSALVRTPGDTALDALFDALSRGPLARTAEDGLAERAAFDEVERVRVVSRLATRIERATSHAALAGLARAAIRVSERASIAELSTPLAAALTREPEPSILAALGATASEDALIPLLGTLGSDAPLMRIAALGGLEAWTNAGAADGRMIDPIAAAIPLLEEDERARAVALIARVPGERADAILISSLSDGARGARLAALSALSDRERPVAEEMLLGLLDDHDAEIRAHAALALARAGGPTSADALATRIESDEGFDRHAALTALGPIVLRLRALDGELPPAVSHVRRALLLALDAEDPALADAAATAIAASEDASLVAELIARLEGAGPLATARLARALAPLDDESARAALLELARSEDVVVQTTALAGLGETGGRAEADALLATVLALRFPASAAASFALTRLAARGVLDASAAEALCALASSHDPHVRANVAVTLARLSIASCPGGATPLAWLAPAAPSVVRIAAARWVGAIPELMESTAAQRALAECASDITQPTVGRVCSSPRMPDGFEDADVIAFGLSGQRLASRLVGLRLDDGSVLVTYADSLGHVRLAHVPRGPLSLDAPESAALMP